MRVLLILDLTVHHVRESDQVVHLIELGNELRYYLRCLSFDYKL